MFITFFYLASGARIIMFQCACRLNKYYLKIMKTITKFAKKPKLKKRRQSPPLPEGAWGNLSPLVIIDTN